MAKKSEKKTFKNEMDVVTEINRSVLPYKINDYLMPHNGNRRLDFIDMSETDRSDNKFCLWLELGQYSTTPISVLAACADGLREYFKQEFDVEIEIKDPEPSIYVKEAYYDDSAETFLQIHFGIKSWYLIDALFDQREIARLKAEEARRAQTAQKRLAKKNAKALEENAEKELLAKLLRKHGIPDL
jgi:Asp-tRNA(Asn)/Glu-tRNA(Gln) amidotransferase A subunit family amidase